MSSSSTGEEMQPKAAGEQQLQEGVGNDVSATQPKEPEESDDETSSESESEDEESESEEELESGAPPSNTAPTAAPTASAAVPTTSAAAPTASAAAPTGGEEGQEAGPQATPRRSRKRRATAVVRENDQKAFRSAISALSGASGEAFSLHEEQFEVTTNEFKEKILKCRLRAEKAHRLSRLFGTDPDAAEDTETHARRAYTDAVSAFEALLSDQLLTFLRIFLRKKTLRQCPPLFYYVGKKISVLFRRETLETFNKKLSVMLDTLVETYARVPETTLKWRLVESVGGVERTLIVEYVPSDEKALETLLDILYAVRNMWSHGRSSKRGVFVAKRRAKVPINISDFKVQV